MNNQATKGRSRAAGERTSELPLRKCGECGRDGWSLYCHVLIGLRRVVLLGLAEFFFALAILYIGMSLVP